MIVKRFVIILAMLLIISITNTYAINPNINDMVSVPMGDLVYIEIPYFLIIINSILTLFCIGLGVKCIKQIGNAKIQIISLIIALIFAIISLVFSISKIGVMVSVAKVDSIENEIRNYLIISIIVQLLTNIYYIYKLKNKK